MEIGVLSCVEPEALRFCFGTVTQGTVAEGARRLGGCWGGAEAGDEALEEGAAGERALPLRPDEARSRETGRKGRRRGGRLT